MPIATGSARSPDNAAAAASSRRGIPWSSAPWTTSVRPSMDNATTSTSRSPILRAIVTASAASSRTRPASSPVESESSHSQSRSHACSALCGSSVRSLLARRCQPWATAGCPRNCSVSMGDGDGDSSCATSNCTCVRRWCVAVLATLACAKRAPSPELSSTPAMNSRLEGLGSHSRTVATTSALERRRPG